MEMVSKKFVCVALLCMVVMAATAPRGAEAVLNCGQVVSSLSPCMSYLQGGPMAAACCPGVKRLVGLAQTTPDRRAACSCLKQSAGSIRGLNYGNAARLPAACGVSIPYKISPSTDCNRVQ